jgi:putative ABC transport system substrate-binding protein
MAYLLDRKQNGVKGLLVNPDSFLTSRREHIASLAAQQRLPAIYSVRANVDAGGLVSCGGNFAEVFRLAGLYLGRILGGAQPADLPVFQATRTELVVTLKTATADEVIE